MKCKKMFYNLSNEDKLKIISSLPNNKVKDLFANETNKDILNFIINKLELEEFK